MDLSFDSFVLAASTADLADEPAARGVADAVEFRLDLADDPLDALDGYDGELPILATNRAEWEGGEADTADVDRLDTLVAATEFDAVAAVDIELACLRADVGADAAARARATGATVVASVHDFDRTPARSELTNLLHEAATLGDVGKLAVTAHSNADALRLLDVTRAATEWGDTVATMAMGEAGRHTRAVAPVYGSKIGYAPVDPADATAPGQYDVQTLRSLVADLSSNPDV
ncbi:type I 3-dehydroquinate dehydratase [Haloferax sp. MBLA0076]|uniref:3-dehydroquinate dehydratase n=1 Tax=Haloferax litoreum TaxID=2666140 RepID=A0A6A8GBN2_9EURY|nr:MULTISPECIES: type I 3-dehydroquinate dehydratase [Haloferax]KAB1192164.1 type I 3-dehydroquinate dehydratase [Haloferax sp. CBA1148]MRX20613.1 type I 3-dehydroquinate dehydratase [Haloferax litoreum]